MDCDKENESMNASVHPLSTSYSQITSPGGQLKGTPIRPLTAAYMAARSENEVSEKLDKNLIAQMLVWSVHTKKELKKYFTVMG